LVLQRQIVAVFYLPIVTIQCFSDIGSAAGKASGLRVSSNHSLKRLLQLRFDFDSASIRLRFHYDTIYRNYDSTAIRLVQLGIMTIC